MHLQYFGIDNATIEYAATKDLEFNYSTCSPIFFIDIFIDISPFSEKLLLINPNLAESSIIFSLSPSQFLANKYFLKKSYELNIILNLLL